MTDMTARLRYRAVEVLQHLTFVSPNATELVAMAQAVYAAQQRWHGQSAHSHQALLPPVSRPPLPLQQQQQQPQQQPASNSTQQSQQQEGAEAGGESRGLLQRLAPHLAVLLQVSAADFLAR